MHGEAGECGQGCRSGLTATDPTFPTTEAGFKHDPICKVLKAALHIEGNKNNAVVPETMIYFNSSETRNHWRFLNTANNDICHTQTE